MPFIRMFCILHFPVWWATKEETAGRKPEILAIIRGKLKVLISAEGQEVVWSMCGSSS